MLYLQQELDNQHELKQQALLAFQEKEKALQKLIKKQ